MCCEEVSEGGIELLQDYVAGILTPGSEKEVVLVSQWPKVYGSIYKDSWGTVFQYVELV